ncbi:uncharacterized protein [Lolium perenne]|uniref:uncharacterized protein n=1 Tax=Lolium perenne TaxID=4522 RepID=UPI003A995354
MQLVENSKFAMDIQEIIQSGMLGQEFLDSAGTVQTIMLLGTDVRIKGVPAVALADTGSTNTFLDRQFVMDHDIDITPAPPRRVKVAGGGILVSDSIAYNHQFFIQGIPFTVDFRVLQLGGSDAILGVNWFKLHNPVTFDFIGRTLSLESAGKVHTFNDHLVPMDDPMISAMECKKLLKDEATAFVLYSIDDVRKTLTQLENTTSQEEFQHVLEAFAEVFDEPHGLPPHRSADHEIPLLPGSKPPNIRPSRMSYNQKNTIEKTIAQLLKNGEIQPSISPFSSPLILVRKKDKSWHLCVDFRGLNDLTVKNKFPIPVIEDLLDELH